MHTDTPTLMHAAVVVLAAQVLLAVGNYLNSGFRGGAYGFKIDAILKACPCPARRERDRDRQRHASSEKYRGTERDASTTPRTTDREREREGRAPHSGGYGYACEMV
jgi:hypothetical protein